MPLRGSVIDTNLLPFPKGVLIMLTYIFTKKARNFISKIVRHTF